MGKESSTNFKGDNTGTLVLGYWLEVYYLDTKRGVNNNKNRFCIVV